MNMNKLTQKSQEAFYGAQNIAIKHGHQEVDVEHLALALLSQENGLIPKLITRMGLPAENIINAIEIELRKRPRVSGAGQEAGKIFVSQRLSQLIVKAGEEADALKDDYISVEHIFLAMLSEGPSAPSAKVFSAFGLNRDNFLKTLSDVRGNQRVTTDNPEDTYEVLEKYGRDLVKAARENKLDPVIGRDEEIRRVIRILSRKTKNNPVLIEDRHSRRTGDEDQQGRRPGRAEGQIHLCA